MKTWIIPCNPKNYDVFGAFEKFEILNWKQSSNIEIGDIVYIYTAKPYSEITHMCEVLEVNLPKTYIKDDDFIIDGKPFLNNGRYITLKLIRKVRYFGLPELKSKGIKGSIQGPRKIDFDIQ